MLSPRPETLAARVAEALGAEAPTETLGSLYHECYGERCHQRPRLLHYLRQYLGRPAPPVPARPTGSYSPLLPVAYKFKDFAKDLSTIVVQEDGTIKEVHAGNVTAYDAERIIADGKGHLLEEVSDADAQAASASARPVLSTRSNDDSPKATTPELVPLLVPAATATGESDAQAHDRAEGKARAKQAADAEKNTDQGAVKVEIVK